MKKYSIAIFSFIFCSLQAGQGGERPSICRPSLQALQDFNARHAATQELLERALSHNTCLGLVGASRLRFQAEEMDRKMSSAIMFLTDCLYAKEDTHAYEKREMVSRLQAMDNELRCLRGYKFKQSQKKTKARRARRARNKKS